MIIEGSLFVGCLIAGISALMGNRAAIALLGSLFIAVALNAAEIPGYWWRLALLDVVVLAIILRPNMTRADTLIAALFVPGFFSLMLSDDEQFIWLHTIVVAQLLLTVPIPWLQRGIWNVSHGSMREIKYGGA